MIKNFQNFIEDYEEFNSTCNHLAEILFPLDDDYKFIDHWYIVKNCGKWEVRGAGGYVSWGEWTDCTVSFPSELLFVTDEEVQKYVDDQLLRRKQAVEIEQEKKRQAEDNKKKELLNLSKEELVERVMKKR